MQAMKSFIDEVFGGYECRVTCQKKARRVPGFIYL